MNRFLRDLATLVLVVGCSSNNPGTDENVQLINGAGATFPYPLYSKWFSEYRKVDPSIQINYQSIGSGGGIRQLIDRTVDFGASDAPMKPEEMQKAGKPVVHIPTVLGAVAISYNLPGVQQELQLSSDLIVGIFLGKITNWNDPKIKKYNPDVEFPNLPISVVYRSDGSGTTSVFTDYLAKISTEWNDKVGAGKSVSWPTGLGGKGNEGVSGLIKQTPGSLGYLELIYAKTNSLSVAKLKNKSGKFILPSVESVTAAADGALKSIPKDYRVSITNAAGAESYPIAAFTYLLVYKDLTTDAAKKNGKKIVEFLNWATGPGQKFANDLSYAPLPESLAKKVKNTIKTIKVD